MSTLASLDWVILAVLAVSTVVAFMHGLLVEVCALAGLVAGVILAGQYYPRLAPWMGQFIHDRAVARAAAFLLLALVVMLAAGIVGRMLRWMLRRVGLGWADRLAGGVFGLVKGYVLVALAVAALVAFFPHQPWLDQSQLVAYFMPGAEGSAAVLPRELGVRIQTGLRRLEQAGRSHAPAPGQQ
jgi:membrane protein required for colicin V production